MEKRGRKFQFNLSNRFLYTFIAIAVIISLGIVVYAVNTNLGYHPVSQIEAPAGCTSGQVLSWSGSAWSCVNNTGSGSSGGEALKKKTVLYKTTSCTTPPWCGNGVSVTIGTANLVSTEPSTGYSSSCLNSDGQNMPISCTSSNTFIGYSVDAVIYNNYSQSYSGTGGYSKLNCLSGENIVSGGQTGCPGESDEFIDYSRISGNGWEVQCSDGDGGGVSFTISITCAK